jgi:hypothetical protein
MPSGSIYTYIGNADASNNTGAIQTSQGVVVLGSYGYFTPAEHANAVGMGLLLAAGQVGPAAPSPVTSNASYAVLGSDGYVGTPGSGGSQLSPSVVTNTSGAPTAGQVPVFTGVGNQTAPGAGEEGAAVSYLPLPTGIAATDTAALNAILAGGGRIRPNPLAVACTYSLTAPLVLAPGGNTDVDFGLCTFLLTGTFNMLQNSTVAPSVTATDASTAAESSVITSPTLAAQAAVGMRIAVVGAGYATSAVNSSDQSVTGYTWMYGQVTAVSGNTIKVGGNVNGVAASQAISGATAYLWKTRDANITVQGGIWNAQGIWTQNTVRWAAANNSSFLRFRRVDGLTIKNVTLAQQTFQNGLGWCFGVDMADVTDALVDGVEGENASTCINSAGPLARITVRNTRGHTQDDMVAFGTTGAANNDTDGDIADLLIDGIMSNNSWTAVDIYSGNGSGGGERVVTGLMIRSVKGTTVNECVNFQSYPAGNAASIAGEVSDITAVSVGGVYNGTSIAASQQFLVTAGQPGIVIAGPKTGREIGFAQMAANVNLTTTPTQLATITVMAPPSGAVLLEASAYTIQNTGGATASPYLSITDVSEDTLGLVFCGSVPASAYSPSPYGRVKLTGLTPGASYVYDLYAASGAGTATLLAASDYPTMLRAVAA